MSEDINKPSMMGSLAHAIGSLASGGAVAVPDSVMTVIADHVRAAIEGSPSITLENVEGELRSFFREALAAAPKAARAAVRGSGDQTSLAAFLLGQAAFAHLLTARTLDTRVNQTFARTLEEKRYRNYLRAMLSGAKDGVTLARMVEEAPETVSRKLNLLRGRGIVSSRQEGTRVVNKLTPAAKAMLANLGIEPLVEADGQSNDMERALAELRQKPPEHFRHLPVMGDGAHRKAA